MSEKPNLVVPSDAVAEMINDTASNGRKAVLLREAVMAVMAKQAELLEPGVAVKVKLTEEMVEDSLSCNLQFIEDGWVRASFPVSATDNPAPYDIIQVQDRTTELIKLVYPQNGALLLSPAENVKVVTLPGFKDLQLVCSADEDRAIKAKFGGGCGDNCRCAKSQGRHQEALDAVSDAPPSSVLYSPGVGAERAPEEGERCKL